MVLSRDRDSSYSPSSPDHFSREGSHHGSRGLVDTAEA